MVAALFVNRPAGGCVERFLTPEIHCFWFVRGMESLSAGLRAGQRRYGRPKPHSSCRGSLSVGNYTKVAETIQYWLYPNRPETGSLH